MGAELGPWASLRTITPLRAEDAKRQARDGQVSPRDRAGRAADRGDAARPALEVAIAQLKKGLSYKDLLAGLFLAGIRNIKPRPVGFKFHAVMVINSAHVLGQSSAVTERLLPLLWALDNFKASQAQDVKEGDWVLEPVDECRLPKTASGEGGVRPGDGSLGRRGGRRGRRRALPQLGSGRDDGAALADGVRDQRNIGHKAIFAAQSWRTLQTIGWEHAEPVLRSLVFGMLDLQGDSRPRPVGPYEANLENAAKIRDGLAIGRDDPAATQALLQVIRQATPEAASAEAVKLLNQGIAPGSLWDAVILAACELLDAQPGHPRPSRHHGHQRAPLHLHGQRRRHDPPARPAPGRRLAADVSADGSS